MRFDALARHLDAIRTAFEITGHKVSAQHAIEEAFLSGWDHAMEVRFEEMIAENQELHGRIMDLESGVLNRWHPEPGERQYYEFQDIVFDPCELGM